MTESWQQQLAQEVIEALDLRKGCEGTLIGAFYEAYQRGVKSVVGETAQDGPECIGPGERELDRLQQVDDILRENGR